jgi:hypothetical protein
MRISTKTKKTILSKAKYNLARENRFHRPNFISLLDVPLFPIEGCVCGCVQQFELFLKERNSHG